MSRRVARARMDDLVGQIYEAASGVGSWASIGKEICDVLRLDAFAAHTRRISEGGVPVPEETLALHGLDPQTSATYDAHVAQIDPVGFRVLEQRALEPVVVHDLMNRRDLERTEYWNEWVLKHGLAFAVGSWAPLRAGVVLGLGGQRDSTVSYSRRELTEMRCVYRHMERAAQIHLHRAESAANHGLLGQLMGSLTLGVLEVDSDLRIRVANAAAIEMLEREDGLHTSRRRLTASVAEDDAQLRRQLASLLRAPVEASTLLVRRPSGGPPYRIDMLPAAGPSSHPRALIVVMDPSRKPTLGAGLLRQAFGLTAAEERVALAIAEDATLQEIAERQRVKVGTVRNQLKRVLEKTGVRRQSELVGLLHRLAGSVG